MYHVPLHKREPRLLAPRPVDARAGLRNQNLKLLHPVYYALTTQIKWQITDMRRVKRGLTGTAVLGGGTGRQVVLCSHRGEVGRVAPGCHSLGG